MACTRNGKVPVSETKTDTGSHLPATTTDSVPAYFLLRDPNKPKLLKDEVPADVLAYLNNVETARACGRSYARPPSNVYIFIMENWYLFSNEADRNTTNRDRFHLGASWYTQVSAALNETMTAKDNDIVRAANAFKKAPQLVWDEANDGGAPHDATDVDAAQSLMILSGATALNAANAAALVLAARSGLERMILTPPPTRVAKSAVEYDYTLQDRVDMPKLVGAPKRKPGRPRKISNTSTTATTREEKAAKTTGTHGHQREESRLPKRKVKMAFEELEGQDGYGIGVGHDEEEVSDHGDKEMGDQADENFSLTGRGRRNRPRKVSGVSDVVASSKLSRSPTKRHQIRRISGFQDDTSKNTTRMQSQIVGVEYDVHEDGMTSMIQDIVSPIYVQKARKNMRPILETPGGATGQPNPSTKDEPARPRRVPSSAGRISAVTKKNAAHSTTERTGKPELTMSCNLVDSTTSTSIDEPTPTKWGTTKNSEEKRYKGKWITTTTGPLKDDKLAHKSPIAKNDSSRPEDKAWDCQHHPLPKTRAKALKEGFDVDDAVAAADYLTLRLSLKKDPETKMEIKYGPPADWDDQKEITALIKVITQHRRRFAGVKKETRHPYKPEEKRFLAKYFEEHQDLQGPKGMSRNEQWEGLAAIFNVQFKGRKSKIASKGGVDVDVPERSWHAIMALCERDAQILKARKISAAAKTTNKRKRAEADEKTVAEQEGMSEEGDEEVMSMPKKRARVDMIQKKQRQHPRTALVRGKPGNGSVDDASCHST